MNDRSADELERIQASDRRTERRLFWAELAVLALVALAAGAYLWLAGA